MVSINKSFRDSNYLNLYKFLIKKSAKIPAIFNLQSMILLINKMMKLFGNGNSLNLFFTQFLNNLYCIIFKNAVKKSAGNPFVINSQSIIVLMIKMMRLFRNESNVTID